MPAISPETIHSTNFEADVFDVLLLALGQPRTLVLPIKAQPALVSLSLIARQITIGTVGLPPHESSWNGLALAYDENGSGSGKVEIGELPSVVEIGALEVWWTGLGADGKREWRQTSKTTFGSHVGLE